jgi:hypothetical protein
MFWVLDYLRFQNMDNILVFVCSSSIHIRLYFREFELQLVLKIKVAFVHIMQNYFSSAICMIISNLKVLTLVTLRMDHLSSLCEHLCFTW